MFDVLHLWALVAQFGTFLGWALQVGFSVNLAKALYIQPEIKYEFRPFGIQDSLTYGLLLERLKSTFGIAAQVRILLYGMDLPYGSLSLSSINQYGSKLVNTLLTHPLLIPRDRIALTLGVVSVISWGIAEVPQIITTYREKSVEGFSVGFLMAWIVGDIFNLVGCLLEPATLKTQFYMALLYTATTAILTAQIVYYGHIYHRLEADKACKPEKIEELEDKAKVRLVGKNSDERGPKMYEFKGSNSLLAGCNMRSSPIPVASPLGSYGSTGRDLYYRSARSLSTSPMSTIGSCAASVQHPCRTSSEMPLLTEDGDSSLVPLLGSLSSSHAARPFGIKNTRCVVSSAAFFVGLYVLQLPVNGLFDTNPQGLVIPVGRKLLQHNALESLHGEHVGSSGIGSFLGWAMAGIYMGGRLPQIWLNIKRGNVEIRRVYSVATSNSFEFLHNSGFLGLVLHRLIWIYCLSKYLIFTAGLSLFMFIFALVGNSTYVGSILVNSLEWSKIKPNLPWLVDAGGCVLLDAFILIQFIYFNYRNAARKAADIESGCRSMIGAQHL